VTALAGVFVGGSGRRMGGRPKGLLRTPEGLTLVERWAGMLAGLGMAVVLVGDARAYVELGLGLPALEDEPGGIGPLGGLVALLRHACDPQEGRGGCALAFACDMPFVSRALVERLLAAPSDAAVVAPRREGRWEPLCARYDAARVLPHAMTLREARDHSLQRLLERAGAVELPLRTHEARELRDWDSPEDVGVG
jgi:molybdopterin-guanine dinucleotide biosynthesis protein A